MGQSNVSPFIGWLYARRAVFAHLAAVYGLFFIVNALYGYEWGVAGYAALLGIFAGLGFAARDFFRFAAKRRFFSRVAGRFPICSLPRSENIVDSEIYNVIKALESERARLERENERNRRDAEEYYTLWVHQIKIPIAGMRLLLQSGGTEPSFAEKSALERELFRIDQYANMALQYQRLSSMQNDLVLREYKLEHIVKAAVKNCSPLFIYKKLPLCFSVIEGSVITDEKWFCFALEQVLTNAAKYTHSGEVRVFTAEPGVLAVCDDGIGIPPEDIPRVFERGFTGSVGHTERSSTGIGLYLCREILVRLGFGIAISSEVGKGTRVSLLVKQETLNIE